MFRTSATYATLVQETFLHFCTGVADHDLERSPITQKAADVWKKDVWDFQAFSPDIS